MNKFFKRLALLLAVLMIVSMMPVQLFADNSVIVEGQSNGTGESYLTISGIAGFEGRQFASFADAYTAIKPVLERLCAGDALGQGVATAEAFDALFTNRDENGNATLTYTISGNIVYDETGYANLLTMGRRASHYGNDRHLINFKFVGATGKEADTLTVNSNITLPYEWWGEKTVTSISFENLTITGSAPSGLYPSQPYFDEINFKVDNCNLKGIKIYNCSNVKGTYTITNSTLDGTGAPAKAYAIHLQGNETEPLTINISGNTISGYDRGINIDQKTANATISGNTISIKDAGRSCIQLSSLTSTVISNNTLELTGGNAITLHEKLLTLTAVPKITVEGNTITGNGYLIYDGAAAKSKAFTSENLTLAIGTNTVASTVDTTQGVYDGNKYGISETVATVVDKALTPAYVATVNGVGYASLAEAIAAAPRKATVKLMANTKENVTISTPYVTLDLNGHTLNGGTEKGKPALTITARVTVMDSSEAQTGTIMREDTAENSGVSSHYVIDIQGSGWLTFESGIVKNNSGTTEGKGASLVRVGDDSVAKYPGLNIKGGTFTQDNFIVIKVDSGDLFLNGGTLNSANSYAVENWHRATIKGGTVNGTAAAWTYSGGHNSALTISGGTVNGNVLSVSYDGSTGKKASVSITGGVVNGTLMTGIYGSATEPSKEMATIEVTGGTFTKDPTKYVIEDSAITKNADGTFGVAKAYLAEVDGNKYYTMEEAFKAQTASGKPIVLLRDYTTGSTFNSGTVARVVDLNGHTWTCTGTDANSAAFEINNANASLTVKNGKIVSSQLVGLIPSAMGGTIKYDNSSLTFENVEMSTTATSGIETNGNNTNDTVTLKNSTLNVPNGFGIYFPSSGKLTLDNSTVNAKTMGVQVCAGSLSINEGSAVTVTGDAVPKAENDGAIQDGAAISIVNRTGYKGLDTVTVSGGKFTAKEGNSAIKAYDWANNTESDFTADKGTVAVSGGTFSSAVPADLCAEGFIPTKNADGTWGIKVKPVATVGGVEYTTLAEAIAAANAGETVTLLADINTPEKTYEITKSLTIDLNGKTVTGSGYDGVFEVTGKNINVVLNATNGGKVIAVENSGSAGKYAMAVWMCGDGSTLTINGGEFIQNITSTNDKQMDMIYASAGTIIINSGSFTSGTPKWTLNINDSAYKNGTANIIVNGGTFTGYDPRNAENEGKGTSLVADGVGIDKNADGTFTAKSGMAAQIVDADGNSVAAYATLADAIAAAKSGATVTLLSNTRENVTISKELTLDLNGHTLSGGTTAGKAALTNYGKLTINDSSEAQTGTIKREDNNTGGYYVIDNKGKLTINGGNVINDSGKKGSSLIRNGGAEDDNAYPTLNIIGGTFTQLNFIAIKNDALSILNVSGGKITSNASAIQNWYKATITGGEINGQLWTDAFAWDGGKSTGNTTISGNAKFNGEIVMDITSKNVVPELNISGGDLNVTNWRITTEAANAGAKPAVSGGTFSSAIPEEYCADGFIPTKNADGTYGVKEGKYVAQIGDVKYETLEEAFAAAKNGDTITLLEDCKSDRINLEDKSVTVVLNGKTLTSTAAYGVMFCAKNGNKITIDGTVEGSKLVGTLMITSGTDGHIEVNGGTYESNQYCPIYVNGAVSSENSTVTVKNAIIKATNSSSDQDMGCGVYLAGYSTSVFENCTITAPITGIEIRAGKLTLNNCNVTGGNGEVKKKANGNGTTVTNAALAISQHTTKKPIDVTISGGTFNGTAAVYQTDVQGTGSADVKIAVKSGTFNGTISGETDGTITISGGKFKVKVDDKYFADKLACSATPNADGYYTVKDHPIISAGISIGEDMSFRIMVEEGYENGSLKYYYIGVNGRVEGEGTIGTDTQGNSIFRIYNVNPQRADLIYVIQYYDADGNAIGAPKEISVLTYFEGFYNMEAGKNEDVEARKTFIANFLEYCASAMERSYADFPKETLDGKTWQYRADAVRAMMTRLGLKVADYEFKGNLGRYYNDNAKGNITDRGIVFGSTFRAYYEISKDIIDSGCRVFRQGTDVTDKLVLENGAYRFYFELAPYEFKDSLTITIYNGTTKVCEYSSPLANTLKAISESTNVSASKLAKAAFNYFVALQNYEG